MYCTHTTKAAHYSTPVSKVHYCNDIYTHSILIKVKIEKTYKKFSLFILHYYSSKGVRCMVFLLYFINRCTLCREVNGFTFYFGVIYNNCRSVSHFITFDSFRLQHHRPCIFSYCWLCAARDLSRAVDWERKTKKKKPTTTQQNAIFTYPFRHRFIIL